MSFKDFWPYGQYTNESFVGWDYTNAGWMALTGNVLNMIDQNVGDMIYLELGDKIKNDTKRRNNLV